MAKTMSTTRNQNHDDDATSSKSFNTCDNSGVAPWSDLNHDALFLVMMQLGVVDFVAFSGVCKSWRTLALFNWPRFMASKPPMSLCISTDASIDKACHLEDFDRRKFKTLLPHSGGRDCVGLTCGYLILFGSKTHDFWLVNPITRHQLHFPDVPLDFSPYPDFSPCPDSVTASLVFSPSINGWVFVVLERSFFEIRFCIAGKGPWNHVSSLLHIVDLHDFKGKIYTIDIHSRLFELKPDLEPKLTLLETRIFPNPYSSCMRFVSSGENLYVMQFIPGYSYKLNELDFHDMKCVWQEKVIGEYALFRSHYKDFAAAMKPVSWADHSWTLYDRYAFFIDTPTEHVKCLWADMWYLPHDCLNVNLIDVR